SCRPSSRLLPAGRCAPSTCTCRKNAGPPSAPLYLPSRSEKSDRGNTKAGYPSATVEAWRLELQGRSALHTGRHTFVTRHARDIMSRLHGDRPPARRTTRWLVLGCLALGLTFSAPVFVSPTFGHAAVEPGGGVIHVVQKGETLWTIARRYGLSVDELVRLNELSDPNRIVVGQKLVIREGE